MTTIHAQRLEANELEENHMSTTKTTDTVEREITELDEKIASMEAELTEEAAAPLSWDEITSTTTEEIARKEQRRGILPRLIHAAKVKRLELEKRRREEEAAPLREKLESTYAAFQAQEERLRKAKERRDAAQAEWGITLSGLQSAEERIRRTEQELHELKGES